MTWTEIKTIIQNQMEAGGVSAYRLAQLTGLHKSTLSLYFSGLREPHINSVLKILDALNLEITITHIKK